MERSGFEMRRLAGCRQLIKRDQLHAYRRDRTRNPVLQANLAIAPRGDQFWQEVICQNRSLQFTISYTTEFCKGTNFGRKSGPGDHFWQVFCQNRSDQTDFGGTDFGMTVPLVFHKLF